MIEPKYTLYLHKTTLARRNEKRRKADSDIQLAMGLVKEDVKEYGEASGSYIWCVLIV